MTQRDRLFLHKLFYIFLGEIVLFSLFGLIWFFSGTKPDPHSLIVNSSSKNRTDVGSATEQFIANLEKADLNPVLGQKITRTPFGVTGTLITLNKRDTIEVFEYPDRASALTEEAKLISNFNKNTMHLYVKDRVLVYYMGEQKDILAMLDGTKTLSPEITFR